METQAGWYPDPQDAKQERYWTGSEWSSDTRAPAGSAPPAPDAHLEVLLRIEQVMRKAQRNLFGIQMQLFFLYVFLVVVPLGFFACSQARF